MNRNKKENQGAPLNAKILCCVIIGALLLGSVAVLIGVLI